MLPNLKFLSCGILFCVLLFAAAGGGVTLPDSRTHVGETPEIGRPMMQESMAAAPVKAQVYTMLVAPRSEEPERLRKEPAGAFAAAPPQPDPLSPDVVKDPSEDVPTSDRVVTVPAVGRPAGAPPPEGDDDATGATGAALPPGAPPHAPGAPPHGDDRHDEAGPAEVAAVARPAAEDSAAVAPFVSVPLPPPRGAAYNGRRHGQRVARREYSIVQHHNTSHSAAGEAAAAGNATP